LINNKPILFICSEFPPGPGGIGKHAYDFSRAMAFSGYNMMVYSDQDYCSDEEKNKFNALLPEKINLSSFIRRRYFNPLFRWKAVINYIRSNELECIVLSGRFSLWTSLIIRLMTGWRFKIHAFIHGSELRKGGVFDRMLTYLSLRSIDCFWPVSKYSESRLLDIYKKATTRILPNGIWEEDWADGIQSVLFPENGKLNLLTVGRISERKGQHLVVAAMPALKEKFGDVYYHMAGMDHSKAGIERLVGELNLDGFVKIHGKVASGRLHEFYESCDIFIMLSTNQPDGDFEGFGIALLEANYFGKPVVGSKGCGIEDAILDGFNGRLVNPNQPQEIQEAIQDILKHYEQYSLRSRQWAMKHEWKQIIRKFIAEGGLSGND
jgi:phosphatidylinositol alpha-1,6-mannosyltransferase